MSDLQQDISNTKPNLPFRSAELETFKNTLASLRKTLEAMRTEMYKLVDVMQEVENTKAEIELLKMAINKTAIEFGLEPMPDGDKKS